MIVGHLHSHPRNGETSTRQQAHLDHIGKTRELRQLAVSFRPSTPVLGAPNVVGLPLSLRQARPPAPALSHHQRNSVPYHPVPATPPL